MNKCTNIAISIQWDLTQLVKEGTTDTLKKKKLQDFLKSPAKWKQAASTLYNIGFNLFQTVGNTKYSIVTEI